MSRRRPKTLRSRYLHRPHSRELAKLGNDLDSASRRAQRLAEKIAVVEAAANGLSQHSCTATLMANLSVRFALERCRVQLDHYDNVEAGAGPDLDHMRERSETLIDVIRGVVAALDFED